MATLNISETPAELARAAAEAIAAIVDQAAGRNVTIALTGGGTPRGLYTLLAEGYRERIEWERVHLFLGDERYVPVDAAESNFRMIGETLLAGLPIPAMNVHAVPTYLPDPESAARLYEATMRDYLEGEWPSFDLVLLGIGGDGHIASLFPGNPALEVTDRWITVVENAPAATPVRISLTLPAINAARNVFFLVSGSEKRKVVSAILGGADYPATRVRPVGDVVWFLDREAAGERI